MCMYDNCDYICTVLDERDPVAQREHRCQECGRTITRGETYHREILTNDGGGITTHKTCMHCMIARQWLRDECGGWVYGFVEEDVREHAANGYGAYPMSVLRLAVGMRNKWVRRNGSLRPVPAVPPTTHERMVGHPAGAAQ